MPDPITVNPSPKQVVLHDKKWCELHRAMLQLPVTANSINYALLEYQRKLDGSARDGNEAAAAHYRMSGALEFVNLFKNLAEPVSFTPKVTPTNANLKQP